MEHKENIIYDAYYLINKFNQNGIKLTNMHIQKLMYFFEAYYMNLHQDIDKLYDCNFNAWAFGPVAIPLYTEFRKFGNDYIELTEDNIKDGEKIREEKKKILDRIYNAFKNQKAMDLVKITHMPDSPWSKVWERNGERVGYGVDTYIDKIESRDWFKDVFKRK